MGDKVTLTKKELGNRNVFWLLIGIAYGGCVAYAYGVDVGKKRLYEQQERAALKSKIWNLESYIMTQQMKEQESSNVSND